VLKGGAISQQVSDGYLNPHGTHGKGVVDHDVGPAAGLGHGQHKEDPRPGVVRAALGDILAPRYHRAGARAYPLERAVVLAVGDRRVDDGLAVLGGQPTPGLARQA